MKLRVILLFVILSFSKSQMFAQASWDFSIWFNLEDEKGNKLTKEDFIQKEIKMFTDESGAHLDSKLEYDTLTNSFKFSQHTIAGSSVLVFKKKNRKTSIQISTQNLFLENITLTGKKYEVFIWNNRDAFNCDNKLNGYENYGNVCSSKLSLDSFEVKKIGKLFFKELVEIGLE